MTRDPILNYLLCHCSIIITSFSLWLLGLCHASDAMTMPEEPNKEEKVENRGPRPGGGDEP